MVEGASVDVSTISQKLHSAIQENEWQSNKRAAKEIQSLLAVLNTYTPDPSTMLETMRETRIGVVVSKLRKHSDECVKAYASRLTNKWKAALDVNSTSSKPKQPAVVAASAYTKIPETAHDSKTGDAARLRVQQAYANERAKKDSRTSIFLENPIVKKVRGRKPVASAATITRFTNPERANMQQKVPRSVAPSSYKSSGDARPAPSSSLPVRPAPRPTTSAPTANMTSDEARHHQRQLKLRALAENKARATGKTVPFASVQQKPPAAASSTSFTKMAPVPSKFTAINRPPPPASSSTSKRNSTTSYVDKRKMTKPTGPPQAREQRKEFLDKMYPRTVGRADPNTNLKQKRKREDDSSAKTPPLKAGERDVMHWLKGLADGDMSQYGPAFFEHGFDTLKLVATMTDKDVAVVVPKRGHARVVAAALPSLQSKPLSAPPSRRKKLSKYDDDDEYDSDDGFLVDDDDMPRFVPGLITSMIRKGRRRRSAYYDDDDEGEEDGGNDSSDMEASYEEIQREESRSAQFGDYEDDVEDRRNRKHKAKKQKRK
ncbi:hypothetical protein DYB35_009204 [Aphanomyces astaci]|uniref:TFIIS N-terminal domain-containing protein n=1 Tax=Aphanomyces astaci TaxID=112090 RepID=A0A418DFX1_APHAT|nr:hypothetical protein DYB35_009204 [Aphanomyces astaci]